MTARTGGVRWEHAPDHLTMCTVSIIPLSSARHGASCGFDSGYRLVTNRDENHRRPPALAPEVHSADGLVPALWPTDPEGGGTWVSVNGAGVCLALLNIYSPLGTGAQGVRPPALPGCSADGSRLSRGLIIPALAHAPSAADAAAALSALNLEPFRGFRLIAVDRESVLECRWEGAAGDGLSVAESALGPACFSSHGWGDRHARLRLALFRRWFADRAATADEQDAFHRHHWASRPEVSVRMVREDARTVSITSVEVGDAVTMRYEPFSAAGERVPAPGPRDEAATEIRIDTVEFVGEGGPA